MWYRARVVNYIQIDLIVYYVDYGNIEIVKFFVVKEMILKFFKVFEVVIECIIDLNRDEWLEEVIVFFEELIGEN